VVEGAAAAPYDIIAKPIADEIAVLFSVILDIISPGVSFILLYLPNSM